MTSLDWSSRYLGLAIMSTTGTLVAWFISSIHIISIAYLTIIGFATLALFHARHLEKSPLH